MKKRITSADTETLIIVYKLLNDSLFLVIGLFLGALLAESLIAGIISAHVSLLKISILLYLNTIAVYSLANILSDKLATPVSVMPANKKTTLALLAFIILLFINSLIHIPLWLLLIATALFVIIGRLTYETVYQAN